MADPDAWERVAEQQAKRGARKKKSKRRKKKRLGARLDYTIRVTALATTDGSLPRRQKQETY